MMAATNRPDVLDPALLRPGPLRPPDPRAAAHARRARRDPQGPHARQEDGPRRRRERRRPGHARHERRRPRQPRERSRAVRGAPRGARGAPRRLRRGPRPRAHGPEARVARAVRGGEGDHRLPRGWSRGVRVRARARRPAAQGDDPAHRHGARCHAPAARSRSATSTSASTSPTRWSCASAAASPRSSSSATSRPARRTTSSATPSSPARWCASGACPIASARWRGARRARCSSARTSCTRATTPTRPPASSTKRSSGSCATRKTAAARCSPSTGAGLDGSPRRCASARRSSGQEVADIVDQAMGRKVGGPRLITQRRRHRRARGDDRPARTATRARSADVGRAIEPQHGYGDRPDAAGRRALSFRPPRHRSPHASPTW